MSDEDCFQEARLDWDLEALFSAIAKACNKQLSEVEKLYFRGLLLGYGPKAIADCSNRSSATVREYLSSRLYRYVEELLALPPNSVTGRKVPILLREYRQESDPPESPVWVNTAWEEPATITRNGHTQFQLVASPPSEQEWDEVPEILEFYGRQQELADLQEWVKSGCRLIAISGSPGIGKRSIAAKLANQVRAQFQRVVWRSLAEAPPLSTLLSDLNLTLGGCGQQITQISLDTQIGCLLRILQQMRCLLVLEKADRLFDESSVYPIYRPGCEEYATLFQRLREVRHQSCVVVTGLEDIPPTRRRLGNSRPVQSMQIGKLDEDAALALLEDRELTGQERWRDLIQLYRSNPYNLKMVAEHISEVFEGDVAAFWKENTVFLGEIQNVLHLQYVRLSNLEKAIIQEINMQGGAWVSRQYLHEQITLTDSRSEINVAIAALKRRSILETHIEAGQTCYSLPALVRKYLHSLPT